MAETLHRPEETQKTFEETTKDALDFGNSGHEEPEQAAFNAARSIVDLDITDSPVDRYRIPQSAERNKVALDRTESKDVYARRRAAAVGVAGVTVLGAAVAVPAAVDALSEIHESNQPVFSTETTTRVANEGDTLWGIAQQIEGSEKYDTQDTVSHIQASNIDVLEDGLQAGESIVVPVSVE